MRMKWRLDAGVVVPAAEDDDAVPAALPPSGEKDFGGEDEGEEEAEALSWM